MIIPTVAQESQNNNFSCKLICKKKKKIIRSLEIYKITLNKNLTPNDDLQT